MQAEPAPPEEHGAAQIPAAPDPIDRLLALLEVILVGVAGGLLALLLLAAAGTSSDQLTRDLGWLGLFMALETLLTLALVVLLLRVRGQSLQTLGLAAPVVRNLFAGVAFLPLLFIVTVAAGLLIRTFAANWVTEVNPLLDLMRTRADVAVMLAASVLTGGFKEEIQRAFALRRFESHLGGVRLGLLLWTVFFAFGHTFQGLDNAVGAGLLGLVFGLLYLWKRNLWIPIGAHAAFNVTTILVFVR